MTNRKNIYLLITVLFSLALSSSVYSQDEPTPEPPPTVEELPPTATAELPPTVEVILPTEVPLPTLTPEPPTATPEIPPTVEVIPPTATPELPTATEEVTAEVTEEATVEAEVTAEVTEEAIAAPAGSAVEMLLQYNPAATEESIQAMLRALGATEVERLPQIGVIRALVPSQVSNTNSALMSLQSDSVALAAGLMNVEPNYEYHIQLTPNDTHFPFQPQLRDGAMAYSIYMESAWNIATRDGQGVTVAVLDTGVDLQHPEFVGRLTTGWDFWNDDNNPDDDNGHGTHVAGIIAARTNNSVGIAGMAFNATILPVKVCSAGGSCPAYEIAAGMIYAVDRGARVLNLSLGDQQISTTVQGAVNYALSRNVVVVAAAGNHGDNDVNTDEPYLYPASFPGVISVASVQPNGDIAVTSASNNAVTLAAPGVNILSTWPVGTGSFSDTNPATTDDSNYHYNSGTSMASPHVAGLAALIIADNIANTPATVRDALLCGTLDMGDVGYDKAFGNGLIQGDYSMNWRGNSSSCQVSLLNDLIQSPTVITTSPYTITQAVNTRSVTESPSDPLICCVQPNQSLWYRFTPTVAGMYALSTLGSNYDTLLGVYEGQPGALRETASNNDASPFTNRSYLRVALNRGVTYYIQLGTNGPDLSGIAQLNINPVLTAITLQQENSTAIRYTGTWNRVPQTGASGGYVYSTTDVNATVSFMARGTQFLYTRMVGPTQGSVEIQIDDNIITPSNAAPVARSQTLPIALGATPGEWHQVILRPLSAGATFTVDAIQVTEGGLPASVVTTRVNETAAQFNGAFLGGTWFNGNSPGALSNNVKFTSDVGAFVQFRARGNAITFYRSTGAGTGSMEIVVDNVLWDIVDNSLSPINAPSVPYSIIFNAPGEHVVRVTHASLGTLSFDGAQAVNQTILTPVITDERSTHIALTGIWTRTTQVGAQANTLSTNNGEAVMDFMFNANHLCVGYQQKPGGGLLAVFIDDNLVDTVNTNGTLLNKVEWCTHNNGVLQLTDTPHMVTLQVLAGNSVSLDFVRPVRRTVFTTSMGYIAETNAGIFYDTAFGTWSTTTAMSTGGYRFQGNSARRANITTAPGDERLSFTINGTGFVLYTSIAPEAGGFEIYVDGNLTPYTYTLDGVDFLYVDMWNDYRFRPAGIGVINLAPGIHHIELRAIAVPPTIAIPVRANLFVDFDGIRVLP